MPPGDAAQGDRGVAAADAAVPGLALFDRGFRAARPDQIEAASVAAMPEPMRRDPTSVMPRTDDAQFYQLYFQEPGVAEAELERDVRLSHPPHPVLELRDVSRDAPAIPVTDAVGMVPRRGGFLSRTVEPSTRRPGSPRRTRLLRPGVRPHGLPRRTELVPQHRPQLGAARALRGRARDRPRALRRRRSRNWWCAFRGMDQLLPNLSKFVPQLRRTLMLPGCGHWTQQERPQEVNAAMVDFLRSL